MTKDEIMQLEAVLAGKTIASVRLHPVATQLRWI